MELLNELQKRVSRTVGPSLVFSPEFVANQRNVASITFFYRCYFGIKSFELPQLVPLHCSQGISTRYSDELPDFSITIPRCYKDDCVNSFFPHRAILWNSLPIRRFMHQHKSNMKKISPLIMKKKNPFFSLKMKKMCGFCLRRCCRFIL